MVSSRLLFRLLPCVLATAFSVGAYAQDAPATDMPVELDTVIVQANPLGRGADDLVQPVTVLAGEELERKRRATIGEVLEGEPGIATTDFGPGVGRPVIRGQGGARVAVLQNGISSMDVSTISNDHAVGIDPSQAEAVEVIKGPATLLYGSGASAGVVNVVDDRIADQVHEGPRLTADSSWADNADEQQQRLDLGYGQGHWMLGLDYSLRNAGDFEIPGYADIHSAEQHEAGHEQPRPGLLENSSVDAQSYGASLAWIGASARYNLAVSRLDTNYGVPSGAHQHEEEGGVRIDLEQSRVDGRAQWLAPLDALESLTLRVGVNDYQHAEVEGSGAIGTRFNNDEVEGRVEAVHRPRSGWRGVLGTQVQSRDFAAEGDEAFIPPVLTQSVGLFAVEEKAQDWGRMELGARVEQTRHDADSDAPSVDFTPLSVSAGALLDLNAVYHLRFTGTLAQRAPAAEEVYAYGPHIATNTFERGNLDLTEETSQNLEVGIDRHDTRWTWSVSLYWTPIRNYVYAAYADENSDGVADTVENDGSPLPSGSDGLLLVDYVQTDAEFYGAELQTGYALLQGPVKLKLSAFADRVRAQLDSGEALPRISPARWGGGMDGGWRGLGYALSLTRVDSQDRVAPLETPTAGYTLLSADLSYTLHPASGWRTQLYLRGRNLSNEDARRHTSFLKDLAPLPGRTVMAGINIQFE